MKKLEVVYEEPLPPQPPKVKEYVLRLTLEEACIIRALLGACVYPTAAAVHEALAVVDPNFSWEVQNDRPLRVVRS